MRYISIVLLENFAVVIVYTERNNDKFVLSLYEERHNMNEKDLKSTSETNWERLKMMSDEEIDTSDIPFLDDNFFSKAKLRMPEGKVPVLLNVDEEILEWYQKKGIDIRNVANSALRDYVETHR